MPYGPHFDAFMQNNELSGMHKIYPWRSYSAPSVLFPMRKNPCYMTRLPDTILGLIGAFALETSLFETCKAIKNSKIECLKQDEQASTSFVERLLSWSQGQIAKIPAALCNDFATAASRVRSLCLSKMSSVDDLEYIFTTCSNLEEIGFYHEIFDEHVEVIGKRCATLRGLYFDQMCASYNGLQHLAGLNVKVLKFQPGCSVDGNSWALINTFSNLQELQFQSKRSDGEQLSGLHQLKKLTELPGSMRSMQFLGMLKQLPALEELHIQRFYDQDEPHLAALQGLKKLSLVCPVTSPSKLLTIASLTNLVELNLKIGYATAETPQHLSQLAPLKNLTALSLTGDVLLDQRCFRMITSLRKLEKVCISSDKSYFSLEGVSSLMYLPRLSSLSLLHCSWDDQLPRDIENSEQLQELQLHMYSEEERGAISAEDQSMRNRSLADAMGKLARLRSLYLRLDGTYIDHHMGEALRSLQNLENVICENCVLDQSVRFEKGFLELFF
jgi:hypothetical protein